MPNNADRKTVGLARNPGWLLALVGFVLAALLAWQTGQHVQRHWESPPRWDVVLDDKHYRVGGAQLQGLEDFSVDYFTAGSEEARELLKAGISAQLDIAFAEVSARLPTFADWYYSLGGEYSRISMALLGHLKVVDEHYVARRAASVLFPEPAWNNALMRVDSEATQLLTEHHAHSQAVWLSELQRRLSANRVPAPIASTSAPSSDNATPALVLNGLVEQLQGLQQTAMMDSRMTLSTVAAASLAGPALWRAVSTRAAMKTMGTVASKGAATVAARGASGAAAGAVACLPGGPVAVACAAVAAAGTWVATDWLLLQVDEALNRDELVAELEEGLESLRLGLEAELLQAYDKGIAAWQEAANVQIEKTFSPYQAR